MYMLEMSRKCLRFLECYRMFYILIFRTFREPFVLGVPLHCFPLRPSNIYNAKFGWNWNSSLEGDVERTQKFRFDWLVYQWILVRWLRIPMIMKISVKGMLERGEPNSLNIFQKKLNEEKKIMNCFQNPALWCPFCVE